MVKSTEPKAQPATIVKSNAVTVTASGKWRFSTDAALVRDGRITVTARLLYLILQSYVGPSSPMPFPSIATLAKNLGSHKETIQRHLKELETWGLIERYMVKDRGRYHSTRYILKPHRQTGKKAHRTGILPLRSKAASKSNHTEPQIKLVRKTPQPEATASLRMHMEQPFHGGNCDCDQCRRERA